MPPRTGNRAAAGASVTLAVRDTDVGDRVTAEIRDRTSWTAAAGRGVIASNAESGNNISTASVVGAVWAAMPMPTTTTTDRTQKRQQRGLFNDHLNASNELVKQWSLCRKADLDPQKILGIPRDYDKTKATAEELWTLADRLQEALNASFEWRSAVLAVGAAVALFKYKRSVMQVIAVSGLIGLAITTLPL